MWYGRHMQLAVSKWSALNITKQNKAKDFSDSRQFYQSRLLISLRLLWPAPLPYTHTSSHRNLVIMVIWRIKRSILKYKQNMTRKHSPSVTLFSQTCNRNNDIAYNIYTLPYTPLGMASLHLRKENTCTETYLSLNWKDNALFVYSLNSFESLLYSCISIVEFYSVDSDKSGNYESSRSIDCMHLVMYCDVFKTRRQLWA